MYVVSLNGRCTLKVRYISDEEVTQQVNDRATLVLASVAKKVQHSRSEWASGVVQRLEQRIGVHGMYRRHTLCILHDDRG